MRRDLAEGLAPIYLCHFCLEIAGDEDTIVEHMVEYHTDQEYKDGYGELPPAPEEEKECEST